MALQDQVNGNLTDYAGENPAGFYSNAFSWEPKKQHQFIMSIGDPYTYLKHMVSPQSAESLKKLIMIFETRFIESIEDDKLSAGMEWKKSAFYNWYEGFKELHEIFYQTELDTDVRDTRLTVAAGGETQSYWISDDDAEKIKLGAGEENPTGVRIGEPIDNINTNAVLWFKRVERNLFIKEPRDTANIIKTFYLKFPQYRWVSFRDMRNQTEKDFAKNLQDCFLSIWVDETSGFGTFPLESMKSGVPVLGLVPNLLPHWMNENNGFWVNNKNQISDFAADFLQNWLEDNIKSELYNEMKTTVDSLSTKDEFYKNSVSLFEGYLETRLNSFEEQLNKLTEVETVE